MDKDEMKNKISMALKDPILQQGFEIICKDLAISEHDREHNDYELTEVYKKVAELEKENAELKKWKEDTIKARGNDYMAWSRQNDQLTKAKEIIHKVCYEYGIYDKDLMEEAKQFLKECK